MERKNIDAGKKAAEELAPDPVEHTPEAPIISEEEAQVVESSEQDEETVEKDEQGGGIIDKVLNHDDDSVPEDGSVRVRPRRDT